MMRRFSSKTWMAIFTTAAALCGVLSILASYVGVFLPSWVAPVIRIAIVILAVVSIVTSIIVFLSFRQEQRQSAPERLETLAREYRPIMLGKVHNKWVTNFLENELYYDELLPLALRVRTSHAGSPIQNPLDQTHALPPGTTIKEVFDQGQTRGRLLILGEAGTGTTDPTLTR
jgi:hypothetical protein